MTSQGGNDMSVGPMKRVTPPSRLMEPIRALRPTRAVRPIQLVATLLMASAAGCSGDSPAASPTNLIILSVDTLRADHLGAWRYPRPTSPRIDAFASESIVFERAVAPSSWTLPSLASAMTSLHASTHGCETFVSSLTPSHDTLAETLAQAGFATAGVGSHVFLSEAYGLQQGFEEFDEELIRSNLGESHAAISSPDVTDKGVRWLRTRGSDARPFFLWLHYFDPHALYLEHPELASALGGNRPVDRYDEEIAFTDHWIGGLLDELEALGLAQSTIVVLFADHGEEFDDHGAESHGHTLHAELTRVPLAIRVPGWQPRRVRDAVSLLDIMPSVLELLGVAPPDHMAGHSLVPLMRGQPTPERPILSQLKREKPGWVFDSLELGRWKLIVDHVTGRKQLYDVEADPTEQRDLAGAHPDVVAELDAARLRVLERAVNLETTPSGVVELSEPERESLEALGYIE